MFSPASNGWIQSGHLPPSSALPPTNKYLATLHGDTLNDSVGTALRQREGFETAQPIEVGHTSELYILAPDRAGY